jgi:AcrR family transcriptional regulator
MATMTAGRRTPRAARRDEARAELLGILERLLREGEAYHEISVDRLAGEAGLSRTTFYVYFEDKGDLLRGWFADATADLMAAAAGWWSLGPLVTREELRAALAHIVDRYRPHVPLMSAMHDAAGADPAARAAVAAAMQGYVTALRAHLEAGQREGFVDAGLPPAETAFWLQGMAERGFHEAAAGTDAAAVDRLVDAYARIVWNALYATGRPPHFGG